MTGPKLPPFPVPIPLDATGTGFGAAAVTAATGAAEASVPGRQRRSRPVVDLDADLEIGARHVRQMGDVVASRRHQARTSTTVPTDGDGYARYGPAPVKQVRRLHVAKFNPGESFPGRGRFLQSDPYVTPELWLENEPLESWVSDKPGHNRHTAAHAVVAPGDLIAVFRSEPKVDGEVLDDPTGLGGRRYLLGMWWAVLVHRRQLALIRTRPVTDVWHTPLVRFDDPVDVAHIRRHAELKRLGPFTDKTRAGLLTCTPTEAAALVAACSLPSSVLTEPDPTRIAAALSGVRTGARPGDLRYARSARARYEYINALENAAVGRVAGDLVADGWAVFTRERIAHWGADLLAERPVGTRLQVRHVEVKAKAGDNVHSVVLERSQRGRAKASAAAADDVWWLAICRRALDTPPPPVIELSAGWVDAHWPPSHVR